MRRPTPGVLRPERGQGHVVALTRRAIERGHGCPPDRGRRIDDAPGRHLPLVPHVTADGPPPIRHRGVAPPHAQVAFGRGTTGLGLVDSGALTAGDFPILAAYNPVRNTVMVDWSGSEFSRLRLQLARERASLGVADNQVFLQYIMSLGAHGAHGF